MRSADDKEVVDQPVNGPTVVDSVASGEHTGPKRQERPTQRCQVACFQAEGM